MEKSQFLRGLVAETDESLLGQIVLWDNAKLWIGIWRGFRKKTSLNSQLLNRIEKKLEASNDWQSAAKTSRYNHQLMKLCRLANLMDLNIPNSGSVNELNEIGLKMESMAVKLESSLNPKFTGNTIEELATFKIKELMAEFTKHFDSMDTEKKEEAANKILAALEELDKNDRDRLLKELDVEKLTTQALVRLISVGSFGGALATVVGISGFSAYTAVSSAIATIFGLVGITLPFSFYILSSSVLAFLTNPLVLIPGLIGLGFFLTKKKNKQIKERLIPVLVTYSVLSQSPEKLRDEDETLAKAIMDETDRLRKADDSEKRDLEKAYPGLT
ncbi:MAG: hypothetical protein CFH08_01058 [Alphaproteobacteria bacterium MarineAlpha3_Bin7]|nr:MAG: hypothetical protein CFH08_01058 [Alphaproteobacteria bacterium MarineAlpha3_Bin7]|tara:strand:+ start:930 stop:1919 length:990 start_codon:yes stop_codon:yes gene_type:complete